MTFEQNIERLVRQDRAAYDRFVTMNRGPIIAPYIKMMISTRESDLRRLAQKKKDHKNELNRASRARRKEREPHVDTAGGEL